MFWDDGYDGGAHLRQIDREIAPDVCFAGRIQI
jgi:hypothetical protein